MLVSKLHNQGLWLHPLLQEDHRNRKASTQGTEWHGLGAGGRKEAIVWLDASEDAGRGSGTPTCPGAGQLGGRGRQRGHRRSLQTCQTSHLERKLLPEAAGGRGRLVSEPDARTSRRLTQRSQLHVTLSIASLPWACWPGTGNPTVVKIAATTLNLSGRRPRGRGGRHPLPGPAYTTIPRRESRWRARIRDLWGSAGPATPMRLRSGPAAREDYKSRRALRSRPRRLPGGHAALAPPRKIRPLPGAVSSLLAALGSR